LTAIKTDYARGLDGDLEGQAIQLENTDVRAALNTHAYAESADINAPLAISGGG